MASVKMTFSLDEGTARRLQNASESLHRTKSEIVREAISDFAERQGRLGEAERRALLEAFDEIMARGATRTVEEVDAELKDLRRSRRGGGRRSGISG